jgi:hypothetical protein
VWKRRGSGAGRGREERRGSRRAAAAPVMEECKRSSATSAVERGSTGEPPDEREGDNCVEFEARVWFSIL